MKRIILFLLITILCLGGCSNLSDTTLSDGDYEVISKSYKQGEIDIKYPQIKGLGDSKKEKKINNLIRNDFFEANINDQVEDAKEFTELNGIEDELCLSGDYKVTLKSDNMISILYEGVSSFKTSMHPNNYYYSITINLEKVKKMSLSDFIDIDDNLIKELKTSKNVTNSVIEAKDAKMTKEDLLSVTRDYMNMEGTEDYIKSVYSGEFDYTDAFAVTSDSLLISVPVYHAAGDCAIVEIPYEHKG